MGKHHTDQRDRTLSLARILFTETDEAHPMPLTALAARLEEAGIPFAEDLGTFLSSLSPAVTVHGSMWLGILFCLIYGGILYAITIRMLRRHLNLE